jgi:protein-disulfide isomerase
MPVVKTAKVGGGELTIGPTNDWQMVVVYRGRHCPLCRRYLAELNRLLGEYHPDVSRRRRYEQTGEDAGRRDD